MKKRARLVLRKFFIHQQCVGTQVDEFFPRDDAANDFRKLFVQQWFAARDRYDRRTALIDRVQGVLHGHILVQNWIRIVDLAAACASEIAPEQWFKHEHKRVALATGQALTDDVATDKQLLKERNTQDRYPC